MPPATDQDVKVFLETEKALGTSPKLDLDAADKVLMGIQVGIQLGNSRHDLRLRACWRRGRSGWCGWFSASLRWKAGNGYGLIMRPRGSV
jgi:hypothetical protein